MLVAGVCLEEEEETACVWTEQTEKNVVRFFNHIGHAADRDHLVKCLELGEDSPPDLVFLLSVLHPGDRGPMLRKTGIFTLSISRLHSAPHLVVEGDVSKLLPPGPVDLRKRVRQV